MGHEVSRTRLPKFEIKLPVKKQVLKKKKGKPTKKVDPKIMDKDIDAIIKFIKTIKPGDLNPLPSKSGIHEHFEMITTSSSFARELTEAKRLLEKIIQGELK